MTDHSIAGKTAIIAGGAKNLGGLILAIWRLMALRPSQSITTARDRKQRRTQRSLPSRRLAHMICPPLSGPETMIVWTTKGTLNAEQEAQAGRDYRQAA